MQDNELKQLDEKYKILFTCMEEGFVLAEAIYENNALIDFEITEVNAAYEKLSGFSAQEILGKTIMELFSNIENSKVDVSKNVLLSMHSNRFEFYSPNTKKYFEIFSYHPSKNTLALLFTDITKRRLMELALQENEIKKKIFEESLTKAKQEAEAANRLKMEILANMSHEIRTPINAVLGFAEILKDKIPFNLEIIEYLDGIQKSGKNLIQLINGILDLAEIEAGKLEINYNAVNLMNLIEELKQIFFLQVFQKKTEIIVFMDETLPQDVLVDELRLRQVLFNLIGNAVKFTDKGNISVNFYSVHKNSKKDCITLLVEVEDTGIGIQESEIDKIFEPFNQGKHKGKIKYGGSGLGLSITKRLVERMNGEIWVESRVGGGTKFSILLKNLQVVENWDKRKYSKNTNKEESWKDFRLANQLKYSLEKLQLSEEFIEQWNIWYKESEIARKLINTTLLKEQFGKLKELCIRFNLDPLVYFIDQFDNLLLTFSIGKIDEKLTELDELHKLIQQAGKDDSR